MHEVSLFIFLTLLVTCFAEDSPVTLSEPSNDNQCDNEEVATVCMQCSALSFDVFTPISTCCSEKKAFLFCEACVKDQTSCKTLMREIEEVNAFSEESEDVPGDVSDEYEEYDDLPVPRPLPLASSSVSNVEKRFGKLFVSSPKRYGRIFFGKRSGDEDMSDVDKRSGRLYMGSGSYFGKRDSMDKRYGRLYMNSNNMFGKRANNMDSFDNGYLDDMDVDKRYGRIYMGGSRYNRLFGKRDSERGVFDKRYGRIFMGGKGLFGKRDVENDFPQDFPNETDDLEKRFEQLYQSRNRYAMRPKFLQVSKRYGRLFTGGRRRGNYLFG